jgi:two-component system, cell cycle sensor histidine kinase and response regulator CckA
MPNGGLLKVSARNMVITKTTPLPLDNGRYVCLTFSDYGKGIRKEDLPKIFDPFFTTKKSGSGLGLTTSYSIIKKHDGHIEVASNPGKGTTVSLYLPVSAEKKHKKSNTPISGQKPVGGKILVMDDEDYIREVMDKMLKQMGCTAVTTANAEQTIIEFKNAIEEGDHFCAVILDLTIPGGAGGRDIVGKLLEIDPHAYIVAASGYSEDPVMSDPVKYGFKTKISKPFRMNELREALGPALGGK